MELQEELNKYKNKNDSQLGSTSPSTNFQFTERLKSKSISQLNDNKIYELENKILELQNIIKNEQRAK